MAIARQSHYAGRWILTHYHALENLPAPGEQWTVKDLDADARELLPMLRTEGIVSATSAWDDRGHRYNVMSTDPQAYDIIQECLATDEGDQLPCGCPFRIRCQGDELECKSCGAIHDTADVRGGERR